MFRHNERRKKTPAFDVGSDAIGADYAKCRGTRVDSRHYGFPVANPLPTPLSVLTFAEASMLPRTQESGGAGVGRASLDRAAPTRHTKKTDKHTLGGVAWRGYRK
jgi:hypothetical protein